MAKPADSVDAAPTGPQNSPETTPSSDAPPQRRDRLDLLKARRQSLAEQLPDLSFGTEGLPAPGSAVPPKADAPAGAGLDLNSLFSAGGDAGKAARAKISRVAYEMVTQTPPDEHGLIPDTPFTSAGITRLVTFLSERASDPASPASKMAKAVLAFMAPTEGGRITAQGLGLDKVQMVSRRIAELRGAAGQPAAVPIVAAPPALQPAARSRPPVQPPFGGRPAGGGAKGVAIANAKAQTLQRQMLMKVRHVLVKTPADDQGWVPGTIFTQTGVARLMQLLRDRAAQPGSNTGAAARKLLDALSARPGEWDIYEGASAEKLLSLAQRLQALSTQPQS